MVHSPPLALLQGSYFTPPPPPLTGTAPSLLPFLPLLSCYSLFLPFHHIHSSRLGSITTKKKQEKENNHHLHSLPNTHIPILLSLPQLFPTLLGLHSELPLSSLSFFFNTLEFYLGLHQTQDTLSDSLFDQFGLWARGLISHLDSHFLGSCHTGRLLLLALCSPLSLLPQPLVSDLLSTFCFSLVSRVSSLKATNKGILQAQHLKNQTHYLP